MRPDTFLYFAYGSSMLTRRVLDRSPSARHVGVATVAGRELRWHKVSKDGSGNRDIVRGDAGSVVYDVLHEIANSDIHALDIAEGLGWSYEPV